MVADAPAYISLLQRAVSASALKVQRLEATIRDMSTKNASLRKHVRN